MNLTDEELAKLTTIDEAATPAPWEWDRTGRLRDHIGYRRPEGSFDLDQDDAFYQIITTDMGNYGPSAADAAWIIAMRTAVPLLLAEVRASRVEIARLQAEVLRAPLTTALDDGALVAKVVGDAKREAFDLASNECAREAERWEAVQNHEYAAGAHHCAVRLEALAKGKP